MNIRIPTQHKNSHYLKLGIGALVLLLVLVAAPANAAPLAGPSGSCGGTVTVICIDPATQTNSGAGTSTVDIRIDNIPVTPNDLSLFGADIRLSFNYFILCAQDGSHSCPNTSNAVTITPGPLLTQTDTSCSSSCYFILTNNADNTTGSITFILTRLNPALSVSGSGVLATISFYPRGGPSSQIHFTSVKLSDRNGGQIAATAQDGVINVSAPTAVSLSSFNMVEPSSNSGEITLDWKTASEINTAGFNIYRSHHPEGPYLQINSQLILASSDPLVGGSYQYQDADVNLGQTYYYQLEDVALNGTGIMHEPTTVNVPASAEVNDNLRVILALGTIAGLLLAARGWQIVRKKASGR